MLTPEHMKQIVDQYLAAINAGDMPAVMTIYADDAEVEDPIGTEPKRGDDILQFYIDAFSGGAKVAGQSDPHRGGHRYIRIRTSRKSDQDDGPFWPGQRNRPNRLDRSATD